MSNGNPNNQGRTDAKASATCCMPDRLELPPADVVDAAASRLKAVAHPVRLKMLHVLREWGEPVCVCDIEAHFELTQPTISHHLRILREAGLVVGEQQGPWVYYQIVRGELNKLGRLLDGLGS